MKHKQRLYKCRLCDGTIKLQFNSKVLNKYKADYFQCDSCGLLQTEKPYWLKEAYKNAIVDADTGLLSRNNVLSKITASMIYFIFDENRKHLDYAGGYGVFTRLMRDKGFDYYWIDEMAENIFAKGFKSEKAHSYQILTAFEYLEHLVKPYEDVQKIVTKYKPDGILFSTTLYHEPIDKNWWYFAFETGQHIAFYNRKALEVLASKLGYRLYSNGVNIHLFSKKEISSLRFKLVTKLWMILDLSVQIGMKSKTFPDHQYLLGKEQ